ncbi:MAG: hypothetical protein Q9172_002865 [Xanthocarpia lactea]
MKTICIGPKDPTPNFFLCSRAKPSLMMKTTQNQQILIDVKEEDNQKKQTSSKLSSEVDATLDAVQDEFVKLKEGDVERGAIAKK